MTTHRHVYVCTACGVYLFSPVPYVVGNDEAWHDKGHDTIRQRDLIPGTFGADVTACGPLREATVSEAVKVRHAAEVAELNRRHAAERAASGLYEESEDS